MAMSSEDVEDILKGLTLRVYRYVLRNNKETGVREVQRALKLSSPTLAVYHLEKLEQAGLIKRGASGYVVDRVYLRNLIRFRRLLIPRYFFYTLFFWLAAIAELTVFRPAIFSREYIFALIITLAAAASYLYETVVTWMKETI
jgi:DNA-binding transcriptional ArsR family regulator